MSELNSISLPGESGEYYDFNIFSIDDSFQEVSAVYCFAKRTLMPNNPSYGNAYDIIYVGSAIDISLITLNHPKQNCLDEHDANCILIHFQEDYEKIKIIEKDLLLSLKPYCF